MAARTPTPEKRPGFFSQVKSLYTFTHREFRLLPLILIGVMVGSVALGVLVGALIPPFAILSVILWGVTGFMFGLLAALMTMTRLSTSAMYRQLDGKPGATGHILSTMLGRSWQADSAPVGVNPRTQEAVYRAIGRGGVVVVGEGARGRLTRLIADERMKVTRVASGVPVTVFYVGNGTDDVALAKLAGSIKKLPRSVDKATMGAVSQRIASVSQSVTSLPIPKGIDPTKVRAPRPR